jgi:hypothetical protein
MRFPCFGSSPNFDPSRRICATTACQIDAARRRLMNPAVALISLKSSPSAGFCDVTSATSALAMSWGDRFAMRVSANAALVAKSPNSGRRGASNGTSTVPASG